MTLEKDLLLSEQKIFLAIGGLFALLSVAAGAFGAHMLKERLSPYSLEVFEIGVRYQFYHALGLIALAIVIGFVPSLFLKIAAWMLVAGVIVFSGSLYMLAFTGVKLWGAVTPIGGLLFILGWLSFIAGILYRS